MSGPALRHVESHHAIHESAHQEAEGMTTLLDLAIERENRDLAMQISYVLVEHWETRTLCHAESEEEGLYKEIAHLEPEKESVVLTLTRDHELMRIAVQEIKDVLSASGEISEVSQRFHFLLWLERTHSRDEERRLIATLQKGTSGQPLPETAS